MLRVDMSASARVPLDHPIWGHWLTFTRDQLRHIEQLAAYGDWVPLRFPPLSAVLINHPSLVEELLVTRQKDFIKPLTIQRMRALVGQGLFTSEGDLWRRQRRLMQPAFHRQRISAYAQTMVDLTVARVAGWSDGEQRDIHQEMMRLTFRIVGQTLFGADLSDDAAEVGAALTEALRAMEQRVESFGILIPDAVPTPVNLRLRRATRTLDRLVYRVIAERRASGQERGDLLSLLLAARDADDGSAMSDRQLRDEVMTLVLAGHETTALALTWAWYLLATHPDAEARLHAELHEVLGDRQPAVEDLPRLTVTNWVIAEALRLYPPAWMIERAPVRDTELGGHRLRANTTVLLSPWAIHRDPRWYQRPLAFEPERWADDLARSLPRFAYLPFGGGPRQCIGNTFALTEAALLLASIARQVRLELLTGQTVEPAPTITLRPAGGLRMRIRRRAAAAPEPISPFLQRSS
jgi:cytochrome P450